MSEDHLLPGEADYHADLGMLVRLHRVRAGLTQGQLADSAHMTRAFLGALERGVHGVHGVHGVQVVRLRRIATALGVPITELLPGYSRADAMVSP